MEVVRLGQGVDKTGQFHPDAITRTLAAVDLYAAEIAKRGVEKIRFCATSATRDATNRDLFIEGVFERLGVRPEVISGEEEASLSFLGATRDLPPSDGPLISVAVQLSLYWVQTKSNSQRASTSDAYECLSATSPTISLIVDKLHQLLKILMKRSHKQPRLFQLHKQRL
jgi:hypothetical protein